MSIAARYVHTNIVAEDWRSLAHFYEEVFGCVPIPPHRSISEGWLAVGTGVPEARLKGVHLRLPGHGDDGPTLEIYQYSRTEPKPVTAANRPGFAHIAFAVEDVDAARAAVLVAGGHELGRIVTAEIPSVGTLTFLYATDPEGNIIELQHWS